jgi:hypothetical protein
MAKSKETDEWKQTADELGQFNYVFPLFDKKYSRAEIVGTINKQEIH